VVEHYLHDQISSDGIFVTAMANLVTTTSADRESVAILTKVITTITDQLAAKDIWAKSKEAEIKRLLGGRAPDVAAVAAGPVAASGPVSASGPVAASVRKSY
jgi:hypothetical protein